MRVGGNNPHAESVGATFRCWHGPFINVISIALAPPSFRQDGYGGITQRIVLRLSVVSLQPHMFRVDGTEMDLGRDLQQIADRNLLPILVPNLHVADSDLWPIPSHLCFPLT